MNQYDSLSKSLRRVIRAIDLYSKKLSRETGLTSPQLLVMNQIAADDGLLVKQVAERINLSPATVTSILDRLESKGFVVRERSLKDKRKVGLHLTATGHDALEDAPAPLQQRFVQRFEQLEEWEKTQLVSNMQRLAKLMDAEDLDASPLLEVNAVPLAKVPASPQKH